MHGVAVVAVLVVTVLGTDVSLHHEAMSQMNHNWKFLST